MLKEIYVFVKCVSTLFLLTVGLFMSVGVLDAQTFSRKLSINPQPTALTIDAQRVVVSFGDLSPGGEWYVGAHVGSSASPQILVTEAQFDSPANAPAGMRPIANVLNWPSNQIMVGPGTVSISGLGKLQGALLVHLTIPLGTSLEVDAQGKAQFNGILNQDILLRNGAVVGSDAHSLATLFQRAQMPSAVSGAAVPDLKQLSNGDYLASVSNLSAHLTSFTLPAYPTGIVMPTVPVIVVTIRIWVDQSGNVVKTSAMRGTGPWLDAAQAAIQTWHFSPFNQNGQPVAVQGIISFSYFTSGKQVKSLLALH
jgi:hypothetical protein